jgi:hypothetical protein
MKTTKRTGAALDNVFRRTAHITEPPNQPEPERPEQTAPAPIGTERQNETPLPKHVAARTEDPQPEIEKPRPVGRPRQGAMTTIPVPMPGAAVRFLDQLRIDIQANTGKRIPRAGLIRAIVSAVEASGIDLTRVPSEEELQRILTDRLKAGA